jgi:pyrroloquinoline quinone (PQQ) biosynthesis protein C
MGLVNALDLNVANAKAALIKAAAADVDQAGRGLAIVLEHCTSNTADLKTAQILGVCMAYLTSALGGLLEAAAGDTIQETIKPGTGIVV